MKNGSWMKQGIKERSVYFVTALKTDLLCCKCIVRLKIAYTIHILSTLTPFVFLIRVFVKVEIAFWVITSCYPIEKCQPFEVTSYLQLQGHHLEAAYTKC